MKDAEILNTRHQKLQQDFEAQLIQCDSLNQENQGKATELKVSREQMICNINWTCERKKISFGSCSTAREKKN